MIVIGGGAASIRMCRRSRHCTKVQVWCLWRPP